MPTMKAIQVSHRGAEFTLVSREVPEPREDEVLLRVQACGVCHGDAVAKEGLFPGLQYPRVPGHEVVGTIERLGAAVQGWTTGQRVGVGWHGGHCLQCAACRGGEFGACERSLTTGLHTDGGYAELMVARAQVLVAIPDGLSSVEAAPLLCAGRTTFGALKSSGARGGDLVAIHGLGGLGHLAVQYAVRLGYETAVVSRGGEKEALARKLGAHHYVDANAVDPGAALQKLGGARVILGTAPNGEAIARLLGGLGRDGELILATFVGGTTPVPLGQLLRGGASIRGWVGGTIEDAIRFSVLASVKPMVEVFPLEQAALAYEKMMTAKVHFRSVLSVGG